MTANPVAREYLPELKAEAARRWLASFCAAIDPGYLSTEHTRAVCEHLDALERRDIDRLMVFMPPRHGKSMHVSVRFPAFYLGKHPEHEVILASYGAELAEEASRNVRNTISEQRYPFDVRLAQDSKAVSRWHTDANGGVLAAGVGGAMTGYGAHVLVIDDPVKSREEADSETIREKAWTWYTDTARMRLAPNAAIVLCQTRWHEDDLAGRILNTKAASRWTVLNMPGIAEDNDVLLRTKGEALWPERYSREDLWNLLDEITIDGVTTGASARTWAALIQQRPTTEEGGMFKRAWFTGRYSEQPRLPYVILSVDSAFKTGVMNDYSVIATWGSDGTNYYVLDVWRDRVEFPELKQAILTQAARQHPQGVYIEDTAAGQSIIQELSRQTHLPIVPVKVTAAKEARAAAVTPICEAGKVLLPLGASWVDEWINEHAAFPTGTHDDMVDTTSMALSRLTQMLPVPQASRMAVTSGTGAPRQEKVWWQEPARGRR